MAMNWKKPDHLTIPLLRPLLVKDHKGHYHVMYYHPKFRDGSQLGSRAKRAWVSVSMDDLIYGSKWFEWIPWNGIVAYLEFPIEDKDRAYYAKA